MKSRRAEFPLAPFALAVAMSLPALPALSATTMLEEVIVTAQRRAQNLQTVPIAITAFGEQDLKNLGARSLDELTEFVSGVELFDDRGAGQPTWVIRGVGLADFNANNTPTAAIYYDDYYLQSNVLGGIGLYDVAGVEILKGPQGGLYGRNASGGAIKISSLRAEVGESLNGYVTGSYGRWDESSLEGAVGGSMTDNSAFRVSAMTVQGGGWQDSLATAGDDEHGDRDFSSVRAQFTFQLGDNIDLWIKAEGGEDKSETALGYSRALYDADTGDFCASAWGGKHNEDKCVTWANVTNMFGLTPGQPGTLPAAQKLDGTTVLSNPINRLDNSWAGLNIQLNWDLDFATLTSITGYLDYENHQIYDFDAQDLILFEEDGTAKLESWSQEFRLISTGEARTTWLAGLLYAEDEDEEKRLGDLSDNIFIFPSVSERGFVQKTEAWAIYGQIDFAVTDAWNLNSSLRYTDESKDLHDAYFYDQTQDFYYIRGVDKTTELEDNWSGHLGLDWTPSNDAMIYGRITRGFKSGGYFGGFAFTEEELDAYGEETVFSYEIGFKTTMAQQTLQFNGAVFFYDYQDVQGFTQVNSEITGTPVTKLDNTGDAEHTGAELDLVWLPSSLEGLSFQLGATWLDAEFTDSDTIGLDPAGLPTPVEGLNRAFSPEWSASTQVRYEWNIASMLAAFQLNYSWRDEVVPRDSLLSDLDYAAYGHKGYSLLNARLSLGSDESGWNVALVGRNLADEEYWARASGDDVGSFISTPTRPASWMIEGTYQW